MLSASFTPKFDSKTIYNEFIGKEWFKFQLLAYELGEHILQYLQTYINSHAKKEHTGNLANAMTLERHAGAGEAQVSWGIGKISDLNIQVPYWKIINYGGSGWHGDYHFTPGFFNGDVFKYNPMMPEGKMLPSGVKGIIKPMNYVEASRMQLDRELNIIIKALTNK
jgi:hypothetical protein